MSANPSWYDLLDVDASASADEIRAAWKAAIGELDPTDRRFRVLNQAAEVLLDPEARRVYDESLQPPASEDPVASTTSTRPKLTKDTAPQEDTDASVLGVSTSAGTQPPPDHATRVTGVTTERNQLPVWILAALGVVLAALLGVGAWLWTTMPPSDQDVAEATSDAQGAAERGIVAIVSYDYRSLDDDQAKAAAYMTADFKKKYDPLFEVIRENAPETKTILSTEVVGSSIVRSGDERVQIFLFINTPTLKANLTEPEVYKNQVTVTMEKVGNEWLVDDLVTAEIPG